MEIILTTIIIFIISIVLSANKERKKTAYDVWKEKQDEKSKENEKDNKKESFRNADEALDFIRRKMKEREANNMNAYNQGIRNIVEIDRREKWTVELIKKIEWKRYEEVCAAYFSLIGYKAETTRLGADGGIDIKLYKKDVFKPDGIVQCKAWNNYKVGIRHIRELYGVMAAEKVNIGIFMTSGNFTKEAKEFKNGKNIALIDSERLLELIKKMQEDKQRKLYDIATEGEYDVPTCPSCGIKMRLRTARQGKNAGHQFWGCRNYPRCKRLFNIRNEQ
jgi:restriction endonuclease Mrr